MRSLRSPFALLFATVLPVFASAQVLHYEEYPAGGKSAVRMTVVCDEPAMTGTLATKGLKVDLGGKALATAAVAPGIPDETPMEFVVLAPVDSTMLRSHETLMKALSTLPGTLASLGHRKHLVSLYTYDACDESGLAVNKTSEATTDLGPSSDFESAVKLLPQSKSKSGKQCPSADFYDLMRKLLAKGRSNDPAGSWTKPASRLRPRVLLVIADGEAANDATPLDVNDVKNAFDRVLILQPDVAPVRFARSKTSKLIYRIPGMKERMVQSLSEGYMNYCNQVKGEDECEKEGGDKTGKELAENLLSSEALLPSMSGPDQFVTRVALINMLTSGAKKTDQKWAAASRAVAQYVPRSTKLDCFAKTLEDNKLGSLIIVGGDPNDVPKCKDATVSASTEESFFRAIFEKAPFYYSRTIEGCVAAPSVIAAGASVTTNISQDTQSCYTGNLINPGLEIDPAVAALWGKRLCGALDLPAAPAAEPVKCPPAANTGGKFPPWLLAAVAAGGVLLGGLLAFVLLRKPKAQADSQQWEDEE
jgi:hypothetical protein